MNIIRLWFLLLALLLRPALADDPPPIPPPASALAVGQTAPDITADDLSHHLTVLTSPEMDGRLTGTDGERRATAYVASVFATLGLAPAGDNGTFFQPFEFTAGVSLGPANRLLLHPGATAQAQAYVADQDWRPLAFSKTGVFAPAALVFAGYGIIAPSADGFGEYDSYAQLDVTDQWVMVFRYLPEQISPELRQHLNRYASLR